MEKNIWWIRCIKAKQTYGYKQLIHTFLKEGDLKYYEMKYGKTYDIVKQQFEKEIIKCDNSYCYIQLNLDRDEINTEPFFILDNKQLTHKYSDKFFAYIKYFDLQGKPKYEYMPIIKKWLNDENKKRCGNLCFRPHQLSDELNEKHFNLFRGFRASKLPICKDYSKIERILFHLKEVICNSDEIIFNWMLKYLKAIIKGKRTDVMIMLKGLEGCGKNIFINMFAYGIIGKEYATATSIPKKKFFGQFNSSLQNVVLAILNEGKSGLRECIDRLKDFITDETISIEKKGKDPIILDFCNFIGDTNNWNILPITPTDRRFVWLECNNQYVGNKEYFDELTDVCKNDEALSAVYYHLIEVVSDGEVDFQKTRPITAVYKKLQRVNLSNPIKFLIHLNDTEIIYKKYQGKYFMVINLGFLYEQYKTFCATNKYEAFQLDQFKSKITENIDNGIKKGLFHKTKVFRFYKEEFEAFIKGFNKLEDLEDMTEELSVSDDVFIEDNE